MRVPEAPSNLPLGINYEVLMRWLERIEGGSIMEAWRELREHPAHVVDVPGTTIEELLKREGRRLRRNAEPDTSPAIPRKTTL